MNQTTVSQQLKDKVAIITGAGQGIGRGIAVRFAAEGAKVVIADMNPFVGQGAADAIVASGGQAIFREVDVSDVASVERLIEAVVGRHGRIDVLVNNAGFAIIGPSLDFSEENWHKMIAVLQTGVFLCSQAAGRVMAAQRSGNILNVASINGRVAIPGRLAYSAAKAAVLMMTKVLAVEWAEYNIRVNAICPGPTDTEGRSSNVASGIVDNESVLRRIPMKRIAQVEEIADAAVFLASERSSYITGDELLVDGGWVCNGSYF